MAAQFEHKFGHPRGMHEPEMLALTMALSLRSAHEREDAAKPRELGITRGTISFSVVSPRLSLKTIQREFARCSRARVVTFHEIGGRPAPRAPPRNPSRLLASAPLRAVPRAAAASLRAVGAAEEAADAAAEGPALLVVTAREVEATEVEGGAAPGRAALTAEGRRDEASAAEVKEAAALERRRKQRRVSRSKFDRA